MQKRATKSIIVLSGKNVSHAQLLPQLEQTFRGARIRMATAQELKNGTVALDHNVLAFVLPGITGDHSPYSALLGDDGNMIIRRYVEQGGVFLGFCAGAYYACANILYDPPWLARPKTSQPGLNFFEALARGPLPGAGRKSDQRWYSDCTTVPVTFSSPGGKTIKAGIAYGNGPLMIPFNKAATGQDELMVMARYEEEPGKPVAVAAIKTGKGLAIFSGVLPYIGYNPAMAATPRPDLQEIMTRLQPHEGARAALWQNITGLIKSHNIKLGRAQPYPDPPPRF